VNAPARAATVAAGIIAFAVAVPTAVGVLLPVEHVAARSDWFPLPPERVWTLALAQFEAQNDGTYAIVESDEPRRFVTELAPGKEPFDGTWTYEFVPEGSGTVLRITERGRVHPPFFRFVARFVIGHTRSLDAFLEGLRARAAV
jgi:hypothetical protein